MVKISLLHCVVVLSSWATSLGVVYATQVPINASNQSGDSIEEDRSIKSMLQQENFGERIPGIVAAIATEGEPIRIAALGIRRIGRKPEIGIDDPMHLGSCTKAMTSILVGQLVEEGLLSFEDTVGERLPELAKEIEPSYRSVTLRQCLTHTTGMPANASNWWLNGRDDSLTIQRKRYLIAVDSLSEAPQHLPGTNYLYSNLGYMIAGMMVEKATGNSWETAVSARLFPKVGIENFGFGIPGKINSISTPWGHRLNTMGKPRPIQGDNAPALGPAGTIFMPVEQWSRFVLTVNQGFRLSIDEKAEHCDSARELMGPETWKQIFAVQSINNKSTDYACGWNVVSRSWAGGKAISHTGSNTMWFSAVWAAPAKKKAYLVAVNVAGDNTSKVVDQVVSKLIQLDRK